MYEANQQNQDSIERPLSVSQLLANAGIAAHFEGGIYATGEICSPPSYNVKLTREEEHVLFMGFHAGVNRSKTHTQHKDMPTAQLLHETNLLELIAQRPELSIGRKEWIRALTENETAKGVIIACYSNWAKYIAHLYNTIPLENEEKVATCRAALMHAIDKFIPEKGFSFLTYSGYWMRRGLDRAAAETFNISFRMVGNVSGIRRIAREFYVLFENVPTDAQLQLQAYVNADGQEGRPYINLRTLDKAFTAYKKVFPDALSFNQPLSPGESYSDTHLEFIAARTEDTQGAFDKAQGLIEDLLRNYPTDTIRSVFSHPDHLIVLAEQLGIPSTYFEEMLMSALDIADGEETVPIKSEVSTISAEGKVELRLTSLGASETRKQIARLALNGMTVSEIAEATGKSRQCVEQHSRRLAKYGLPVPRKLHMASSERQQEIATLLLEGQEQSAIAEKLGLKKETVGDYIRRLMPPLPITLDQQTQLRHAARTLETDQLGQWLAEHPTHAYGPRRTLASKSPPRPLSKQ